MLYSKLYSQVIIMQYGLKLTIYYTRGDHVNNCTTDEVGMSEWFLDFDNTVWYLQTILVQHDVNDIYLYHGERKC